MAEPNLNISRQPWEESLESPGIERSYTNLAFSESHIGYSNKDTFQIKTSSQISLDAISNSSVNQKLEEGPKSNAMEEIKMLRAQMLGEAIKLATIAFDDKEKAKEWLSSEVAALEFKRPVDMLTTITGYERVKALLGQIIFGVY